MLNAFTIDVEDYFQVTAFERDIPRSQWADLPNRVVHNTQSMLQLLDEYQVHGTFFVLGWIAERFPDLVREIHGAGHEIGSHGYWHRLVYEQTPDEFREDIVRSRDLLSEIIGEKIACYRAPTFSITRKSWWALDVLAEEGFTVDSSIFPIRHDRYGVPDANPGIHQIETTAGTITEFPPSTVAILGRNMPVAGGGYFRLMPLRWTSGCIRHTNEKLLRPFMFYIHPWEIDPQQPLIDVGGRMSRFRHRVNLGKTRDRLSRMLASHLFGRVRDVVANELEPVRT